MARGVKAEPNSSRDDQGWRSVNDSNDPSIQQQQSQPQRQRRERHPSQIPRQEQQHNEPEQDVAQRRAIRRRFRDVKNLINEERDEIYRPGSDKFDCIITEVQKLHEQVHKPREQVADAEALLDITNNLLTTVKAHKSDGFTPGDFINSLIRDFGKQDIANDSTDGSGYTLLWKEVGLAVSHVLKRAPGCCTMLGPMSVEMKQKKRRTVVRTKRGSAEKERPEELSNKKEEMTDTDKNMRTMFDILKKNRKAPLENLILNRNYFAQTVENLFALSFLVKDGRAEITVDKDGNHFVFPKNAPAANAVASGQVSYCHFVFRFDFKDWKLMLNSVMEGEELMPHRLTLLLGPPGCGKTSLLLALSGNMNNSLKVLGDITYNGYKLTELVPQKNSVYVSQHDLHIPQFTVRETLEFSARCQGVGTRAEMMIELCRREKQAGIIPDPDVDAYMKAISAEGLKSTLQTDYILKILGLDVCADTIAGDAMRRGISGGEKKRLTSGEMIVGPNKALLMDEITNGLDSSTAFQIIAYIQQLVHITDATALIALLQPAPETFNLFDDIVLMAEGKIIYNGPRSSVLDFFEECGFKCPQRKGVADFLQEVISIKDQEQYWFHNDQSYNFISVDMFCQKFKESNVGRRLYTEVSQPYVKSESDRNAISFNLYSLPKWELLKACMSREYLLMKRNSFLYVFRTIQLVIVAVISMTLFLRTRLRVDIVNSNYYLGILFYTIVIFLIDGFAEAGLTVMRLPVFFKQRDLYLYPAWAYTIPASIMKIPISVAQSLVWTSITYYVIGYSPEAGRFFRQFLLLSTVHLSSMSLFRFIAALFQTMVASLSAGSFFMLFVFIFSGFIIPRSSLPTWLKFGFWMSPLSYGEIAVALNEFLAPRWQKAIPPNSTIGKQVLEARGLNFAHYYYWISIGALLGFALLANICYTFALTFLKAPGAPVAIISREKLARLQGVHEPNKKPIEAKLEPGNGRMIMPFQPLTVAFMKVNYYVDTPMEMKERGFTEKKLRLLSDITGAFRPGVLTALMGVSGAGKTTLLDVLSGRKTSGYIEGDIRISGYPKAQESFARVSGYCEQADIHSPQITVEESIFFSAWLRLPHSIDPGTRKGFVDEVLRTIELDEIKDALVGIPGVSGLSTEQRKRLTIAVELVSNPSIIFMDEPTTGLDSRAAAIVMRAVNNVAATGRTVVCTIHQPSIDIFEAFDELILLKTGGKVIYSGPLGQHSQKVIGYFEDITGVPKIKDNYNPSTWMMEVTSTSAEAKIGLDFAQVYQNNTLYRDTEELVQQLSTPSSGSEDLHFRTRFSQNGWQQFKSCLWKLNLSYWRSPSYNLMRIIHTLISSLIFGIVFWNKGRNIENQQSLFTVLGSMFGAVFFLGINNCTNVLPSMTREREVVYRERFAGMYSSWAYSFAQVTVELPYLLVQATMFTMITYPLIGYYPSPYKILWYLYCLFTALMYFNYMGLMLVSLSPNYPVAIILCSPFFAMFSLFAGFYMPAPMIPKWWIWLYHACPTSWTLNGMLTSQYGDIETMTTVYGRTISVSGFLRGYFGFHRDQLALVAFILIAYPLLFASLFAVFMHKLNFQKR